MQWDFSVVATSGGALLRAAHVTAYVSIASIVIGTMLGSCLGLGALSSKRVLRYGSRLVIETFLALPVLVLVIWIYYCLPLVDPRFLLNGFVAATLGLSLSLAAFVAEIVQAGVRTVPRGQLEVALCLGMSWFQTVRSIVAPQAIRRMLPPLMGQYVTCYKLSTLASVVAVPELLHTGSSIIAVTYRPLEVYTAIAVIFAVTVVPLNMLARSFQDTSRFGGIEQL
jgi:polar amino acid transport system permease protein